MSEEQGPVGRFFRKLRSGEQGSVKVLKREIASFLKGVSIDEDGVVQDFGERIGPDFWRWYRNSVLQTVV